METVKNRICRWLGIDTELLIFRGRISDQEQRICALEIELFDFKEALKARARQSVFDGEKSPEKSGRVGYVPVARRRAQAEYASLGPKTHDEKVRENNTRAIESA